MATTKINPNDDAAMDLLKNSERKYALTATRFVKRPVWFSAVTKDSQGNDSLRNQVFLEAGWYCSEAEWEQAEQYLKEFPKLNEAKRAEFKQRTGVTEFKDIPNPLKAVPLDIAIG